jgi:hypothetical protein
MQRAVPSNWSLEFGFYLELGAWSLELLMVGDSSPAAPRREGSA